MKNAATIIPSFLASTLAAGLLQPAVAMAQGAQGVTINPNSLADAPIKKGSSRRQGWDVTVGGGLIIRPTFEGSDRHTTTPLPLVNATWNDRISIGANGLSTYWRQDRLRYGAGLTYNGGREDSKSDSIFKLGDDRLRGLGNIDAALGIRAFASYDAGPVLLSTALTKFTGDKNDGVLMNLGVSKRIRLNDRWSLTPNAVATWANQSYMQTFYGVTPMQGANSRFAIYNAGSGFKDFSASINANYRIDSHWFVTASFIAKKLVGDAAKSPISFSDSQTTLITLVGYHF